MAGSWTTIRMKLNKTINNTFVILARIVLGCVLIYSSFDKIADPFQFASDIRNYSMPTFGLENLMAMILPWLELLTGFALILGIMVDGAAWITALMMGLFIVAIGQAVVRGIDIECGCGMKEGEMVGLPKLIEDAFYLLLAVFIIKRKQRRLELLPKSI